MTPRKSARISDRVSRVGDNPKTRKSNSKTGANGQPRLPLDTSKLRMRKCQDGDVNVKKLCSRACKPVRPSKPQKTLKGQRKSSGSLPSLKKEVINLLVTTKIGSDNY